ncbi:uncharacterized mitochondrial protein AtMg00810-like [Spinacia oleracea]|uniref:Uncharacterized mitochondrial protein AtMg00810-like n=1 Tax=Spinacia oleracea TaxID=3562 RepID=A0ABM3RP33_SPIOL|nr:uncharacterized mitochondrial protein AtMg00810-like [Spinacia oleracea]
MSNEYNSMINTHTWDLVPRPVDANVIRCLWVFTHKEKSNGDFERHKARLVANGKRQEIGIDCGETETVYMHQPPGFVNPDKPKHVCLLRWSIYGLKQAPPAWYQRFATYIISMGFINSKSDTSLFIYRRGTDTAYLLLYVDDIILTCSSDSLRTSIIARHSSEFAMKDLCPLSYFLGISVSCTKENMLLCQRKYAQEILARADMSACKSAATPVDTKSKLSATSGKPIADPSFYRQLARALQYLTFTHPDISYAVQHVCLFMHDPREPHLHALKRVLRYIKGTLDFGMHFSSTPATGLVSYTDADWGGCPDTRRSTSGYCVFVGDNLLSWSSKRQATLSRSSAEAEYRGVANVVANRRGLGTCYLSSIALSNGQLWFIVIILVRLSVRPPSAPTEWVC